MRWETIQHRDLPEGGYWSRSRIAGAILVSLLLIAAALTLWS